MYRSEDKNPPPPPQNYIFFSPSQYANIYLLHIIFALISIQQLKGKRNANVTMLTCYCSRHSQFLRDLFKEQSLVVRVGVEPSYVDGFPPIVNVRILG